MERPGGRGNGLLTRVESKIRIQCIHQVLAEVFQRKAIRIYVIMAVLGLLSGSILVYAAFAPNSVLTADQLNQARSIGVDQQWINMLDSNNPTTQTRSTGVPYQNDTGS